MKRFCLSLRAWVNLAAALLWVAGSVVARAQDIEPRAYSNAPIGVNFLGAGYAQAQSDRYRTSSEILGYAHVFELAGQSARFDVVLPYADLTGSVPVKGQSIGRATDGLTDPLVRLSVNLYGAPALSLKDFADYKQDLIIGTSLTAAIRAREAGCFTRCTHRQQTVADDAGGGLFHDHSLFPPPYVGGYEARETS